MVVVLGGPLWGCREMLLPVPVTKDAWRQVVDDRNVLRKDDEMSVKDKVT